jgi:hypothetical protein
MSKKSAKFAAAIAFGVAATFTLTAIPRTTYAADECLTEPKGATSPGKHWFYHVERGTGRKCWYQRGQDDGGASASSQDQSADASDDASSKDQVQADQAPQPIVRPPARRSETPATRSIDDARAEWPAKTRAGDNSAAAPAMAAAPQATAAPAATSAPVAAASPAAPSASVFPDPSTVLGTKPTADAPSPDTTASVAPEPEASPAPVAHAAPVVDRQSTDPHHRGSIPMLLMVAFGALGLAGLTGSTVYRLASVSRSMRRQDRWQRNVQLQPAPTRRPRPIQARPEPIQELVQEPIDEPIQDEFEHDRFAHGHFEPEQLAPEQLEPEHPAPEPAVLEQYAPRPRRAEAPRAEPQMSDANNRREHIEAYLAQLTRQLQADLQAHARAE